MKERDCDNCKHHTSDGCSNWDCEFEARDLISRADAIAYIDRVIKSGLGRYKSLNYIRKYISALPSADAVSREECDKCKTDKEGVLIQQLAELQGDYETMKNAYEDALADAEWIPCSERLPSEDGQYLVCMNFGYDNMDVLKWTDGWNCFRYPDGKISRESEIDGEDIVAWMPLPKPYKGGDDE